MGERILRRLNTPNVRIGIFCVGVVVSIVTVTGGVPIVSALLGGSDREQASVQNHSEEITGDVGFPQVRVFKRWELSVRGENEAELQWFPGNIKPLRVEITRADTEEKWLIQLHRKLLKVKGQEWYALRFRARADDLRNMGVAVGQAHEPWETLGLYRTVSVMKEWKDFTWEFLATADDPQAQIYFDLGGWNVPVELESVRLLKLSHGMPQWKLSLVGRSEAELVGLAKELEGFRVTITTVDTNNPNSIQLIQSGVEVRAQERYRLRFDARADVARGIYAAIGQDQYPGEGLGLYQRVSLSHDWQSFELEFVAQGTDDHARLYFDLGEASIPVELKAVRFSSNSKMLVQGRDPSVQNAPHSE